MPEFRKSSTAIQPASFDAPNGPNEAGRNNDKSTTAAMPQVKNGLSVREGAPWWHSQFNMMLCAFALLVLAALMIVVLIPKPAATSQHIVLESSGESTVTDKSVSDSASEAPWSESRRQQARSDTQDLLAELLNLKKVLESKQVTSWANADFEAALEYADLGDEFYKSKDFGQALTRYQEALSAMQNLENSIPKVIATFIRAGDKALASGKSNLAKDKFQSALALDQNHIPALSGLDRALTLDKVLALVESAQLE
jgi:tetratricopeptide (TPR) repeat protein